MPRLLVPTFSLLLVLLATLACGSRGDTRQVAATGAEGFKADLVWLEGPKVEDYSSARLTITRTDGTIPASVSEVVFEPMMPTHGHGSFMDDQQIIRTDDAPNVFVIRGIYFTMRGTGADRWVIALAATVDGKRSTLQLPVDVP